MPISLAYAPETGYLSAASAAPAARAPEATGEGTETRLWRSGFGGKVTELGGLDLRSATKTAAEPSEATYYMTPLGSANIRGAKGLWDGPKLRH